ncbi:MAG: hypothetical protein LUF85_16215 [Bacteroides sp.]|nr:hypothetical protein [Bacteroides sp.]
MMTRLLSIYLGLITGFLTAIYAQTPYTSLHPEDPISWDPEENKIIYQEKEIILNEKNFFIDGRLSDRQIEDQPYVFNSIQQAVAHLQDGTEEEPMRLHIAPYVYWIDDPDDESIRMPERGSVPFGMTVRCNWLTLYGLSQNPQDVVLASNRGQTQGASGNYTMFFFDGDGLCVENLTLGNYCNVDLEYRLLPELNREKRSSTITQAQLAMCNGDKIVARNCQFISRLNSYPLGRGKRTLFDRCYFECTDDALAGTGVYLDCRFTFFSSKPFYQTHGTGAAFLNCDFHILTRNRQYLTKVGSPVTLVDCRFTHETDSLFIGWTQDPTDDLRCYQYNVTLNDTPILVHANKPWLTVDMTGKSVLDAYRIEYQDRILYNTYNLLQGEDEWDPMDIKTHILSVEKQLGRPLTALPTYLRITPEKEQIESGSTVAALSVVPLRFGNYASTDTNIHWSVSQEQSAYVRMNPSTTRCLVKGTNENDETQTVWIMAHTASGLESAAVLTVAPAFTEPPAFLSPPRIIKTGGTYQVEYQLNLQGRKDESLITWYRCENAEGAGAHKVAVSHRGMPEYTYQPTWADQGYYFMATIEPKHLRCHPGEAVSVYSGEPADEMPSGFFGNKWTTDFRNFPTDYQPELIPGIWTVDAYKPLDVQTFDWTPDPVRGWDYTLGMDNAKVYGLTQVSRGARLLYTPIENEYGDMSLWLEVAPCKSAGQGFGSATGQYMDIYIKFDPYTLSGYGLRILRTTKYDHAVDFMLMKYENGEAVPIPEAQSSTCFVTTCQILLKTKKTGNGQEKLYAWAGTTGSPSPSPHPEAGKEVMISTLIEASSHGGIGIQHTGSTGANATLLQKLECTWE